MITEKTIKKWQQPSEKQQQAGNYFKPRLFVSGLEIAIENPAGTVRTGSNADGTPWETAMTNHYGYVVGSKGADGDEVDVYIGDDPDSDQVFVVHQAQYGDWDQFDEDKCMLFFTDQDSAEQAYLSHYDDPRFLGSVTAMSLEKFKSKVLASDGKMIKSHLIDLSGLSCNCENHALEELSKSISEDQHDIWAPHENPFVENLIELFTERGLLRIDEVKTELNAWLTHTHSIGLRPTEPLPGMAPSWSKDELSLVKLYLESLPPESWTLEDYDYLVQYLFQRYLPSGELMSDADWLVTKSHLSGKVQAHLGSMTPSVSNAVSLELPNSIFGNPVLLTLSSAEKQIMSYARLRAMDSVVAMTDAARHSVKSVMLDSMQKQLSGDESENTGKLQQALFDKFSVMNRDWRRIALTEAGEACNQGFISSLPVSSKVKRLEMYNGACGFCKKLDGRIFNVVSADDPDKNGETDVWPGKTNIGRSISPRKRTENGLELRHSGERFWCAAGVQHPHCRGRWIPLSQPHDGDSTEFSDWFNQHIGAKAGLPSEAFSLNYSE